MTLLIQKDTLYKTRLYFCTCSDSLSRFPEDLQALRWDLTGDIHLWQGWHLPLHVTRYSPGNFQWSHSDLLEPPQCRTTAPHCRKRLSVWVSEKCYFGVRCVRVQEFGSSSGGGTVYDSPIGEWWELGRGVFPRSKVEIKSPSSTKNMSNHWVKSLVSFRN